MPDTSVLPASPPTNGYTAKALSDIEIAKNANPQAKLDLLRAEARRRAQSILDEADEINGSRDYLRIFGGENERAKNFVQALYPPPLP